MNSPVNESVNRSEAWIFVHYFYKSSGSVFFPVSLSWWSPTLPSGEEWATVTCGTVSQHQVINSRCRTLTWGVLWGPMWGGLCCHRLTACPPHLNTCDRSCPLDALTPTIKRQFRMRKFDIHILQHKPGCHAFKSSCLPYLSICIGMHTSSRSETGYLQEFPAKRITSAAHCLTDWINRHPGLYQQ